MSTKQEEKTYTLDELTGKLDDRREVHIGFHNETVAFCGYRSSEPVAPLFSIPGPRCAECLRINAILDRYKRER